MGPVHINQAEVVSTCSSHSSARMCVCVCVTVRTCARRNVWASMCVCVCVCVCSCAFIHWAGGHYTVVYTVYLRAGIECVIIV